jgi:hypothetical protein
MHYLFRRSLLISFLFLLSGFLFSLSVNAQTDSLVMKNGDVMVGEIKKLRLGIVQIETAYSDDDFTIEWDQVKYIKSDQIFLVTMSKGLRYNGSIESDTVRAGMVVIHDRDIGDVTVDMMDIFFFKTVDQTFISRLDLSVSLGYTLTKANNSNQTNFRFDAGYLSNTIGVNLYFNRVSNFQQADDSVRISSNRTEGGANFQFFLIRDWFAGVGTELLQSSEQKLKLRALTKAGIGNYLVSNQVHYLILGGGGAWNFEEFEDPAQADRNSFEVYAGMEYNIFDMGDLDLKTSLFAYPGITEWGRFRSDLSLDLKYEFISDFFVNLGFTLNYDNQPVNNVDNVDYVFQTTVGWEL